MPGSATRRYAYLHGFASSAASTKGTFLRDALGRHGIDLRLLELNVPSFEAQTYSGGLALLDETDADDADSDAWNLIGSSLGGYLSVRWAELHPERVDRLVLLCPAFDLPSRWPVILGEDAVQHWEEQGFLEFPDESGRPRPVPWSFAVDARSHPGYPEAPCPTLILHGTGDEVVPVERSRRYAASRSHVRLIELDDDHVLSGSLERIARETRAFLEA